MSKSQLIVALSRFWSAVALSVTLHAAVVGALTSRSRSTGAHQPITSPEQVVVAAAEATTQLPEVPTLPVEIERRSELEPRVAVPAVGVTRILSVPKPSTAKSVAKPAMAPPANETSLDARSARHELPRSAPVVTDDPPASFPDAGRARIAVPGGERDVLHQAMQAAARGESPGPTRVTQPIVRVDPHEKNLDRAFARAFAWAFALDRGLFTSAPLGKARFVIELADDGRIDQVHFTQPPAPARLKELVARMVKLLTVNRFRLPTSDDDAVKYRAFDMTVTQSQVSVPLGASADPGQAGDIWMLGAGETPILGHPSHPTVADATGHQISCELSIVEPVPNIL